MSSSSSSSSSSEKPAPKTVSKKATAATPEAKSAGKRKEVPEAKAEAAAAETPDAVAKRAKVASEPKKPFSRIKDEDWDLVKPQFADNRFEANAHEYGAKAHEVLSQVRGRGFRHEKQKKKNSYRGGTITDQVRSVKFED